MTDILNEIERVLNERKTADPDKSYVAGLYARGVDAILKKIGEEAAETVIAGKGGNSGEIVHEIADLWFHTMVLLTHRGIKVEDVMNELRRRFGVSGLDEQASRQRN
jgi:phosphoribosyl-ATP pyrophosphohydrolase